MENELRLNPTASSKVNWVFFTSELLRKAEDQLIELAPSDNYVDHTLLEFENRWKEKKLLLCRSKKTSVKVTLPGCSVGFNDTELFESYADFFAHFKNVLYWPPHNHLLNTYLVQSGRRELK